MLHSQDFRGMRLRCNKSPIAVETFLAVNADPVQLELEDIPEAVADGRIVGGESTYARFFGLQQDKCCSLINDAEHSLFLTSIIVSQGFWTRVPEDLKLLVQDAALDAARSERQESLEDAELVKARCKTEGIRIVTLPAEERDKFKSATEYLYEKFADMFSPGLVEGIRAAA
eukprot:TRINITY_DN19919_c0_g1_i2.p1 TRINITY_DN19919_c0_g1~~TRINITY_DN19919_c0_g1_i2.p1  ORF type:complete len:172 (-),score=49.07 TRINITY_DN19919_c0_g1_i2:83-598(-)